ncbi:MAG: hypothetical protein GY721_08765, partial [Deltaproteobacteria bacterium]|nr:hypothetical protein [Deltaproteobacteria bacterium]
TPKPPFIEHDHFEETQAVIDLIAPDGSSETISLSGPTQVDVFFDGVTEGSADDDDNNGLEEVDTEIVLLNLTGSSSLGPVSVRLNPDIPSRGMMEETANNTTGLLDLPPFTSTGTADSFFDVFFEVEINGLILRTLKPKRMSGIINHKPPDFGDFYENLEDIELFTPEGRPSGFFIGAGRHTPKPPFIEHDHFEETQAQIDLIDPNGNSETISLSGPTQV